jgi:hypothetical protein
MSKERLPIIYLSSELAHKTASLLDSFAQRRPSEGIVYWFGLEEENTAVVTTLIVPDADTTAGSVSTSAKANADVMREIVGTRLVYLGQAHSHPGSNVYHSCYDDDHTFAAFSGAISVVVPWFGRYGFQLEQCGIYRHLNGRFQAVRNPDRHLKIIPGLKDLRI